MKCRDERSEDMSQCRFCFPLLFFFFSSQPVYLISLCQTRRRRFTHTTGRYLSARGATTRQRKAGCVFSSPQLCTMLMLPEIFKEQARACHHFFLRHEACINRHLRHGKEAVVSFHLTFQSESKCIISCTPTHPFLSLSSLSLPPLLSLTHTYTHARTHTHTHMHAQSHNHAHKHAHTCTRTTKHRSKTASLCWTNGAGVLRARQHRCVINFLRE
jgi:hypothetical protein